MADVAELSLAARAVRDCSGPFTLGTVQIGQKYGLAQAQPDHEETMTLLDRAARSGIVWIDTARAYGAAEDRIGDWLAAGGKSFRIVTKIRPLAGGSDRVCADDAKASLEESLQKLRVSSVDICLVHRAADLRRPGVADVLRAARSDARIGAFGASVYTTEELEQVLAVDGVGAVQLPLSVVSGTVSDRAMISDLVARGITVFVRSVFLQGALLMPPDRLPPHLIRLAPVISELRALADTAKVSLPALLIAAVKSVKGVKSLVLGVESILQLDELVAASSVGHIPSGLMEAAFDAGRNLPREVTDPRLWPKT